MDLKHMLVLALACIVIATIMSEAQAQVGVVGIFGKAGKAVKGYRQSVGEGNEYKYALPGKEVPKQEEGKEHNYEPLKEAANQSLDQVKDSEAEKLKVLSSVVFGTAIFGWLMF
ncbi:hypothetical protein Leryth_020890 [Lithospermum erythrorhizon]|nr:hypothetical protein Leryth_020890 [Lithospermum erythrorhizon]